MNQAIFNQFCSLVYEHSGINLTAGKEALVVGRVGKRVRQLGLPDERAYLQYLAEDTTGEELVNLLDVISTNVTSFYREADHFEVLQHYVRQWVNDGQQRLRIWSAACSSGQEPYTVGTALLELLEDYPGLTLDARILATDISTRVLQAACAGQYCSRDVQTIPPSLRQRYFETSTSDGEKQYTVCDELRRLVTFRRLNLSKVPFPMQGPMDVIFCRNVMIYFDNKVRTQLVREFERLLKPGGLLMIGHSESLAGIPTTLGHVKPSVYQKGLGG